MNIAFCINRKALPGFASTIVSMLRNCAKADKLVVFVLHADLKFEDQQKIRDLLEREQCKTIIKFIDFDAKSIFGNSKALYNDWTTYGRLLLPRYIADKQVLYLDADLVIEKDVSELEDFNFNGLPLAVVQDGCINKMRDANFYRNSLHLPENQPAFNAGVLLLNLDVWRKNDYTKLCIEMAVQYQTIIHSHDQTILNGFFKGNFATLPLGYNSIWYLRNGRPNNADKMILHFVGSPKPWDPLGRYLHDGFNTWGAYTDDIWIKYVKLNCTTIFKRIWVLKRAYIRMLIINAVMYFRNRNKR